VELNQYIINTQSQIEQLKKDLMKGYYSTNNDTLSFSKNYKKVKNEETSKIFEDNIRQSLIKELNWEVAPIERHFFYREIFFNHTARIIKKNEKKIENILNAVYAFKLNDDSTLEVRNEDGIERPILIQQKNIDTSITYEKSLRIIISKVKEIEIDGAFLIKNFNLSDFNTDEIDILYNNYSPQEYSTFNYCILEAKLSLIRIDDLIEQIIRDKDVFEKIFNNHILYLGVVNSNSNYRKQLQDIKIKCLIIGIKCDIFFGRKMNQILDWNVIKDVEELKKEVKGIKQDVEELKKDVKGIKHDVSQIKDDISQINKKLEELFKYNKMNFYKQDNALLGKKRNLSE
jgi:cell division septum initiation protein DivIVA